MKSTSKNFKLAIAMIISGVVLMAITGIYFIFQSNQWVQNNTRWFVFASGIVVFTLGIVMLLSVKHNYPNDKDNNANNTSSPKST
jgi:ABC-type multidrug transport system permease subunit